MTELDLYKFITERGIERRWEGNELLAWISRWELEDFTEMIKGSLMDDGGRPCRLQTNVMVCIDLVPICEYYGIEAEQVVHKTGE